MYPRDGVIARRYDPIDPLTHRLWWSDQFYLHPATPVIRIFLILFILAIGFLEPYEGLEYLSQKIYYDLSIIFYGMVRVYL